MNEEFCLFHVWVNAIIPPCSWFVEAGEKAVTRTLAKPLRPGTDRIWKGSALEFTGFTSYINLSLHPKDSNRCGRPRVWQLQS